jgi:hypothetical protein
MTDMNTAATRTEIVLTANLLGYGVSFTGAKAQLARVRADGGRGEEITRGALVRVRDFLALVAE